MSVNYVLVLDTNKKPLTPCKPSRSRSLLKAGKAAVFRQYPLWMIDNQAAKAARVAFPPRSKERGFLATGIFFVKG